MKTIRYFILAISIFSFAYHMANAASSVTITEVMFDHEGTDEGKEWVEIYNDGTESIPIASWYFFENEVNHKLTPLNFENLEPGDRAVIIQNEATFKAEFSGSIKIIKSSFSLNNEGEGLAIHNSEKVPVDSITYDPAVGGAGNGTTYGLIGSTWSMTEPSPGSVNEAGEPTNEEDESNGGGSTDSESDSDSSDEAETEYSNQSDSIEFKNKAKKEFEPYYHPYINFEPSILSKNASRFRIGVFHVEEYRNTQEIDGFYYVNFGDGTGITSEKRIDTFHAYPSSGSYVLSFEFYKSRLARELGEDPDVLYRKTIKVLDETITILGLDSYGSVILENPNKQAVNLQDWKITLPGKQYVFPKYSMIAGKSKIAVPMRTLGFGVSAKELLQLRIFNNQNIRIATYSPEKLISTETGKNISESKNKANVTGVQISKEETTGDISLGPNTSFIDEYLEKNPQANIVDFNTGNNLPIDETKKDSTTEIYLATGGGLLVAGLSILKFLAKKESPKEDSQLEEH
jgi:hypothetical protein